MHRRQEVWRYPEDGNRLKVTGKGAEEQAEETTRMTPRHHLLAGTREQFGRTDTRTATGRPYHHKDKHERSSDELGQPQPLLILRLYRNAWMVQPFHEKEGPRPETEDENCTENASGF
ncbi:Podospora anserina S mat+ genomic DNA chromosome 2, supercontig 2 [Trichuris trichiura]|uniref:Podospora anserina S mat+ genomic DNA chromosome 2, supercontig 2 n=1 Tax=Trichuris trichiura TaxID=36087 RepID=A0A077Z9H1_TRITR|nr:Podospora anserina S mat+ genomic DNA chromosome 2, supercontig 2 [Trichuris trichiura]